MSKDSKLTTHSSLTEKLRQILLSNNGGSYWDVNTAIDEIITAQANHMEELLDRIEQSLKSHTTPEGKDLLTRSYIQNTLDFERQALKELEYDN